MHGMDPGIASELARHRSYLLRVARLQLRDPALAEDVVQDTLAAALAAKDGFTGKSSVKTWLTGILKHKIVDAIRRKQRDPVAASSLFEDADLEDFDALFTRRGTWDPALSAWPDPEQSLSRREFMEVVQLCLDRLPPNTARVFMMREVLELSSDEICKELAITANNLWVILYRARMSLRQCLDTHWFEGQRQP
jgi:RNA polymerase sigma-70 factor (ECF subfamily)